MSSTLKTTPKPIIPTRDEIVPICLLLLAPPLIHMSTFPSSSSYPFVILGGQLLLVKLLARYEKLALTHIHPTLRWSILGPVPAAVFSLSTAHQLAAADVSKVLAGLGGTPLQRPMPELFLLLGVASLSGSNFLLQVEKLGR